jgi:hypothetical protein
MRKIRFPLTLCNVHCVLVLGTDAHELIHNVTECLEKDTCVELLVINEVGADIKIVTDTDTFTRFDAASNKYCGG